MAELKKGYLDWKVRDQTGKTVQEGKIEATNNGRVQKRISRRTGQAVYLVFKGDKIVHIHCKAKDCGNEWKIKDSNDWSQKFDVKEGLTITCNKCGKIYEAG